MTKRQTKKKGQEMTTEVCSVCQGALIETPGGLACTKGLHEPRQAERLCEFFFVTYRIPALTGEKLHEAGPYGTRGEARDHRADIEEFEGVEQVEIIGRFAPSTKPYNGEDMIGG